MSKSTGTGLAVTFFLFWTFSALLSLAVTVAGLFIAWHFIAKFW
jgi:hypothetical protein